jgi:hypothetical protein
VANLTADREQLWAEAVIKIFLQSTPTIEFVGKLVLANLPLEIRQSNQTSHTRKTDQFTVAAAIN